MRGQDKRLIMKIIVIGGTGLIGSKVVERLRKHGHEVIAAAPSSGVNTITGEGLDAAMSGVHTVMTNTRDTPVEALERELPVRVRRSTLRRGSGGAGDHRGGDGIERDLEVLVDTTVSLVTERRSSRPAGTGAGAGDGAAGENWRLPGGDESAATRLADKCTVELRAGDVLRVRTPGGGGWSRG